MMVKSNISYKTLSLLSYSESKKDHFCCSIMPEFWTPTEDEIDSERKPTELESQPDI